MKVYFRTLGCPKNEVDSDIARQLLQKEGWEIVESPGQADAVVVNTCAFIQDAKEESIEAIFSLSRMKEERPVLLAVSGCLGQRYNRELFEEIPEADLVIGVNDYQDLGKLLDQAARGERLRRSSPCSRQFEECPGMYARVEGGSAYLKIAEGCNNRCTYCVIPQIRGGYRSRRMEAILDEAVALGQRGAKELVLIAQDVTGYGKDLYGSLMLPALLKRLEKVEGVEWIRLMYCYPDKITDQLIEEIRRNSKVCPYVDMPVQHASQTVLKAMNRAGGREVILSAIQRLRERVPDIALRTTVITGFPGEDREQFEILRDFVEEIRFDRLGVFAYSKEENTPAAQMKPQVRKDVKERRRDILMELQQSISLEKNREKIGSIQQVFVEEGPDEEGAYYGRTRQDAREIDNGVIFTAEGRSLSRGDIIKVRIVDAFDYDLAGEAI